MAATYRKLGSLFVVEETITGAASNNGTMLIDISEGSDWNLGGRQLLKIITVPGAAALAPSAYTIPTTDALGKIVFTVAARSTTAVERWDAVTTLTLNEYIDCDWTMVLTGMGEAKTAFVRVLFK